MCTSRSFLVGMVVLMMVAGLVGAVLAQDEVDPMAPAYFTFTLGSVGESTEGDITDIDDSTSEVRGMATSGIEIEASDPRASGLLAFALNADSFSFDDLGISTVTTYLRLVNDGGAWSGTGSTVTAFIEEGLRYTNLAVLTGEGGYEGLILIMSAYFDDYESYYEPDSPRWGVIIPSDGMPPVPDFIEPPIE